MARPVTRLVTAPASEPVSLQEAGAHLRLEGGDDTATVTRLITAARQHAEEVLWRGLVQQTWELILDAFPDDDAIVLPRGHLATLTGDPAPSAVTWVKYIDAAGVQQTLATTEYGVDSDSVPGRVVLGYGKSWPGTRDQWDAVRVRYVVGWAAASVPEAIKQAVLLLVSQMYEHRTPEVLGTVVARVQFAVDSLLVPYSLAEVR